jgi:uncharacterized membrane-anchored protein
MYYSEFTLTDEERADKNRVNLEKQLERNALIEQYVIDNKLVKLKSNEYGMDSYYYDTTTKKMYKVHNLYIEGHAVQPFFCDSDNQNILLYNSLI